MQLKHKLSYMALGGILVIIGQMLPSVITSKAATQGKAKDAEFDIVTCRSLKIVDISGKVRAKYGELEQGYPVQIFNQDGVAVFRVQANSGGGQATFLGNDGIPQASIGASPEGGGVNIWCKKYPTEGKGSISMGILDNGGYISVSHDFMPSVMISALEEGGELRVQNNDGKTSVLTKALSNGGGIALADNNGKTRATIAIGSNGGHVWVINNNDKTCASMGITEYGHGMVSTWDKNGNKTGNLP